MQANNGPVANGSVFVIEGFNIWTDFAGTVQFLYVTEAFEKISFVEFVPPVLLVSGRCFWRFRS